MNYENIPYEVAPMRVSDIDDVMQIERQSFPTPWTPSAYRYELKHNRNAYYYVVRPANESLAVQDREDGSWRLRLRRLLSPTASQERSVLGYIGFWVVAGEAHISTIAIDPEARRQGLGELLLVHIVEKAMNEDADFITLEVRVSNRAAQHLYEKYGFERTDRRKNYYSDNREDAWIMTLESLDRPEFKALFHQNKRALVEKLSHVKQPASEPSRQV